jgi:hypothetical protein
VSARTPASREDIAGFVGAVVSCCPGLQAIWRVGQAASGAATSYSSFTWDLIAFGDAAQLQRLQGAVHLHRSDVRIRVVTDGNRFESAWGAGRRGSLDGWEWMRTAPGEAFYSDFRTGAEDRQRLRYRAVRLWHAIETRGLASEGSPARR